MANFFARNIDRRGRIVRALWGLALIIAGVLLWTRSAWICFVLVASGAFALYEVAWRRGPLPCPAIVSSLPGSSKAGSSPRNSSTVT